MKFSSSIFPHTLTSLCYSRPFNISAESPKSKSKEILSPKSLEALVSLSTANPKPASKPSTWCQTKSFTVKPFRSTTSPGTRRTSATTPVLLSRTSAQQSLSSNSNSSSDHLDLSSALKSPRVSMTSSAQPPSSTSRTPWLWKQLPRWMDKKYREKRST